MSPSSAGSTRPRRPSASEVSAALDYAQFALRDPAVLTKDRAIALMWQPVQQLVPVLLGRHWTLEIARKPQLLSSDTPVVVWRRPSPRDQYEGVGVENAEEIRFPLDPGKQLVLTPTTDRPPAHRVEPGRVSACNADIASGCHRFIVGHPHRPRCLQRTTLALKRPVLRFNLGLLYTQGPPGTMVERGEVLHVWVPRRGANRA